MNTAYDRRVGFSGHQSLSAETRRAVRSELLQLFPRWGKVLAMSSLAAGSDQIFAECALSTGNDLMAVIPCEQYESTFNSAESLAAYWKLLDSSADRFQLPFPAPSEEAYWAAGKHVVETTDLLVAVWDGLPAGGLGGTADVVHYAEDLGIEVVRIWPAGASRK
jgi:hypothetical protein